MKKMTRSLVTKARSSALQAVAVYNDPRSHFRTGTFTVLMSIAWTALLHASFERRGLNYHYKKPNGRYERIDGDKKAWDLTESVKHEFEEQDPIRKNIELFLALRHKIEHRDLPALDPELVGECQALLINFESWVVKLFGEKNSLLEFLFVPIQFSAYQRSIPVSINEAKTLEFIQRYRSLLDTDIASSQEFAFKAFLVPKIGNHRSSSNVAIEFVKFDQNNPEEMRRYEKMVVGIREKQVPVVNLDLYKPSQVLIVLLGEGFEKTMTWHTEMWKKHKVRPLASATNKEHCKSEYCHYDSAHGDYLYTQAWIELLLSRELNS